MGLVSWKVRVKNPTAANGQNELIKVYTKYML